LPSFRLSAFRRIGVLFPFRSWPLGCSLRHEAGPIALVEEDHAVQFVALNDSPVPARAGVHQEKIVVLVISAHHPAMLLQSGNPFLIAFVAFDGSNFSGLNRPPTHSSISSCCSLSGF